MEWKLLIFSQRTGIIFVSGNSLFVAGCSHLTLGSGYKALPKQAGQLVPNKYLQVPDIL
jgi:hypothetical protein